MQRILVVDDEERICRLLERFLEKNGFEVLKAQSGESAVDILNKEHIDLVILDKRMPGMGGLGVVHYMRENNLDVPFFFLTGSLSEDRISDEFKDIDNDDILPKPIDLYVLLDKVKAKLE